MENAVDTTGVYVKADGRSNRLNSSSEVIVAEILAALYDGRYVPGQRLIEADLTRRFKVSRGSVREALNRLAAEGVVTLTLHRGAFIRQMSRAEVVGVLQVTEVIIGLAARLAAENIKQNGCEESLQEAYLKLMSFKDNGNYMEFVRARNGFYRAMIRIGGNRELGRVLPSMHVHLVRMLLRTYATRAEQTRFEDYEHIFAAIVSGDSKEAERAGREHIGHMMGSVDRLRGEAFPDEK